MIINSRGSKKLRGLRGTIQQRRKAMEKPYKAIQKPRKISRKQLQLNDDIKSMIRHWSALRKPNIDNPEQDKEFAEMWLDKLYTRIKAKLNKFELLDEMADMTGKIVAQLWNHQDGLPEQLIMDYTRALINCYHPLPRKILFPELLE